MAQPDDVPSDPTGLSNGYGQDDRRTERYQMKCHHLFVAKAGADDHGRIVAQIGQKAAGLLQQLAQLAVNLGENDSIRIRVADRSLAGEQ